MWGSAYYLSFFPIYLSCLCMLAVTTLFFPLWALYMFFLNHAWLTMEWLHDTKQKLWWQVDTCRHMFSVSPLSILPMSWFPVRVIYMVISYKRAEWHIPLYGCGTIVYLLVHWQAIGLGAVLSILNPSRSRAYLLMLSCKVKLFSFAFPREFFCGHTEFSWLTK